MLYLSMDEFEQHMHRLLFDEPLMGRWAHREKALELYQELGLALNGGEIEYANRLRDELTRLMGQSV